MNMKTISCKKNVIVLLIYVENKFYALSAPFTYVLFSNLQYDHLQASRISWSPHIIPLEEYCHNSKNTTFQGRGKTKF